MGRLKQIRVSDKASFKDISAGIKVYINKMSHRKISIRENLYTGIFVYRKESATVDILEMLQKTFFCIATLLNVHT